MPILTIETTTSPFSGAQLDAPISINYDSEKINLASVEPQDGNTKCRFLYMVQESVSVLPFDSAQWGMAYVNCTAAQLIEAATPVTGPEVTWLIPNTAQTQYINPATAANNVSITLGSVPDSMWTLENINKGTATNSVITFEPSVAPEPEAIFSVKRAASTPLSGVITMDAVATANGGSTTTPLTWVIRPANGRTPSGTISNTIGTGEGAGWAVTTNIPCTIEFVNQQQNGTGISFAIINNSTTSFFIGGENPTATGQATFTYKLTSIDNPLCFVQNPSTLILDCDVPAPGLTIDYDFPANGIGLIDSFGQDSVSCSVFSPDAGTKVWSVENIVNPTGGGGYVPSFDDGGTHYFEWSSVGATNNGTVTFDIRLTIGAETTTKPFQVVISNFL